MAKSILFSSDILKLVFNGDTIANIADDAGTSPLTNLYVSLHTGDPGTGGSQTTNEAAYTSYARVAVARTSSGWTITSNSVSPNAEISFPECTGSAGSAITHAGVGTDASGTGKMLYSGSISPTITMAVGVTPILKTTTAITES